MVKRKHDSPSRIVDIAASGDLILVVGPEQLQLRVHSQVPQTASTSFSAMLGPTWNPSHDLPSTISPAEYPLPEDNATAMKYTCAVIHLQNNILPRSMQAQDIFEIPVIAKKYDLIDALRFASESWLAHRDECPRGLILLTAAAYAFQNPEAFKDTTRALVLKYDSSLLDLRLKMSSLCWAWKYSVSASQVGLLAHDVADPLQNVARGAKKHGQTETRQFILQTDNQPKMQQRRLRMPENLCIQLPLVAQNTPSFTIGLG